MTDPGLKDVVADLARRLAQHDADLSELRRMLSGGEPLAALAELKVQLLWAQVAAARLRRATPDRLLADQMDDVVGRVGDILKGL